MSHKMTVGAIALSLLLLAGCQAPVQLHQMKQPLFALGQASEPMPVGAAALPGQQTAAQGQLVVRFDGDLARLIQGRRIQATVADVDRVVVTVTPQGGVAVSQTVLSSALANGQTSVTFNGLSPGDATVTITAFDVAGVNIGATTRTATVTAGQVTSVDVALQLSPTYVASSGGGTPATGGLAANVTIVDGPTLPAPLPGTLLGRYLIGSNPWGISVDSAGNAWVIPVSLHGGKLVQVAPNGTTLRTVSVGMGLLDVAVDAEDQVWVLDIDQVSGPTEVITLYRLSSDGTVLGTETVNAAANSALVTDSSRNVWLMLNGGTHLRKLAASGVVGPEVALDGVPGDFTEGFADGFAVAANGEIWVVFPQSNQIRRFDENGAVLSTETLANGLLPSKVVVDPNGGAWVAASSNGGEVVGKLMKLGTDGRLSQTYDLGYSIPMDLVAHQGAVWVGSASELFRLAPGAGPPELISNEAPMFFMAAGSSGIWLGYPDLIRLAP